MSRKTFFCIVFNDCNAVNVLSQILKILIVSPVFVVFFGLKIPWATYRTFLKIHMKTQSSENSKKPVSTQKTVNKHVIVS